MKSEDSQNTNNPQLNQYDSSGPINNQNLNATTDQHSFNPNQPYSSGNKKKFPKKLLVIAVFLLLAFSAVAGIIWFLSSIKNGSEPHFFGNTILRVSCSDVVKLAKNEDLFKSSKSKYRCFAGNLTVGDEKVKYVNIQLTPEFEKEQQQKCSLDCGFSPAAYPEESENVGEFIVRANGKIENYTGYGGGGLDSLLSDLTGCGTGSDFGINDKLNGGTLVLDNHKISLLSDFSNLKVKDSFGNVCSVDLKLISYLTTTSDQWELTSSVKIKSLAVDYTLNDISSCKNESAPSATQSCFTTQAALRNNLSVCENLASPTPNPSLNPGFDDCVIAVAKRKKDPRICDQIRYYREELITICQTDTKKLKTAFRGEIVIR